MQLEMLPIAPTYYGGVYRRKARGRGARPLSSTQSIHLVLRSSKAHGPRSFIKHRSLISRLVESQAKNAHVRVISWANVGNHLHLHIQLPRMFRESYRKFVRGLTGAIALRMLQASRCKKRVRSVKDRSWDQRPFTHVVGSWRQFNNLRDYIRLNHFEGLGFDRIQAYVAAHDSTLDSS
jgi:REP element-mobilizing transposase RayT